MANNGMLERFRQRQQTEKQPTQQPTVTFDKGAPQVDASADSMLMRFRQRQQTERPQQAQPEEVGVFEKYVKQPFQEYIVDPITGESKLTEETRDLPELSTMRGVTSGDFMSDLKTAAGLIFTGTDEAKKDIIKENLPGVKIHDDEKGTTIIEIPDPENPGEYKKAVLNKPGLSFQDAFQTVGDIAAFFPASKIALLAKSWKAKALLGSGAAYATDVAQQAAERQLGSKQEYDPMRSTVAGALGGTGELVETGVKALAKKGAAKRAGIIAAEEVDIAEAQKAAKFSEKVTEKTGIPLLRAQKTGSISDLERQSYVATLPAASRVAAKKLEAQNKKAYNATMDYLNEIAPEKAVGTASERVRELSQKAIEAKKTIRKEAASPLYKKAFQDAAPVDVRETVSLIDEKLIDLPEGGEIAKSLQRVKGLIKTKGVKEFNTVKELRTAADRLSPKAIKIIDDYNVIKNTPETRALPFLKGGEKSAVLEGNRTLKGEIPNKLTVWRKGDGTIKQGDFVSIEKNIASDLERKSGKLTSKEVNSEDVYLASDAQEFFYIPKGAKEKYKTLEDFLKKQDGSNLKKLHNAKLEIDQMLSKFGENSLGNTTKRELLEIKGSLLEELDIANPKYKEARKKFSELSPAVEELEGSIVGKISKLDDEQLKGVASKLFNPKDEATNPALIRKVREVIEGQDKQAWRDILRTEIALRMGKAKRLGGETFSATENVPGKLHNAIFGNTEKRKVLYAALGKGEARNLRYLEEGLKRAAKGRPGGSQTAGRQVFERELRGGVSGAIRSLFSPATTAAQLGADYSYNQKVKALASVMFDPEWKPKMKDLRKYAPGSKEAESRITKILKDSLKEFGKPALQTTRED